MDTALKVSQSVYYFITSISHGGENYFPRLWGTGISDAIFEIPRINTVHESPETKKKKKGQKLFWSPTASTKPSGTQAVH